MGLERRGRAGQVDRRSTPRGRSRWSGPKPKVKSFEIRKRLVFEAWEKVQANGGAPGVDAVSISRFGSRREGQPLQAVEPDVVGELLPRAGAGGGDTEGSWSRGQDARGAHGPRIGPVRSKSSPVSESIVVTHPFHPLAGQRLVVIFEKAPPGGRAGAGVRGRSGRAGDASGRLD